MCEFSWPHGPTAPCTAVARPGRFRRRSRATAAQRRPREWRHVPPPDRAPALPSDSPGPPGAGRGDRPQLRPSPGGAGRPHRLPHPRRAVEQDQPRAARRARGRVRAARVEVGAVHPVRRPAGPRRPRRLDPLRAPGHGPAGRAAAVDAPARRLVGRAFDGDRRRPRVPSGLAPGHGFRCAQPHRRDGARLVPPVLRGPAARPALLGDAAPVACLRGAADHGRPTGGDSWSSWPAGRSCRSWP